MVICVEQKQFNVLAKFNMRKVSLNVKTYSAEKQIES